MILEDGRRKPRPRNRLVTRLLMEMQVGGAAAIIRAFDGDFDRAIIFSLIARSGNSLPAIGANDLLPPGTPITVNAIASSLYRPFETMRRHVNALLAAGLVIRGPRGVCVSPEAWQRDNILEMLVTLHDLLIRFLEDLVDFGIPLPLQRAGRYDQRRGMEAAIDILLTAIEFNGPQHDAWLEMVIFGTVMTASARPITYDQILAFTYGEVDTPPPEDVRAPVAISGIARALALPYPTIRRHVERLLKDGRLVRRQGGVMISPEWLAAPALVSDGITVAEHVAQVIARLASCSGPMDITASGYITGRPPLLDFS